MALPKDNGARRLPMKQENTFIRKFGIWSDEQHSIAGQIAQRVRADGLKLVRLAWPDIHGVCRAKTVTVPAFLAALENGYNINVATAMLDPAGARVFSSFTQGGGLGLAEMTGSPNLTIVPDPETFRVLPTEPDVGWVLCDEYFPTGVPFHFSPRQMLRRKLRQMAERDLRSVVGLEVEWYLVKLADEHLSMENTGSPGRRGRAPRVLPVEPGFSYHSETNLDRVHHIISALARTMEGLNLPLRSIENEWGPGQIECTFGPEDALTAADNLILFRTATRQLCRRMGYLASFMSRPRIGGFYASGWHLHQSVVDAANGRNLFMPEEEGALLSPLGMNYLGGLADHALPSTIFANPTVNGYRRFRINSLAPDRVAWCSDHRGAMLRVLGGAGDGASRIENRVGEPSANPYLYILSQLASGYNGILRASDPGPSASEPYAAERPMLPATIRDALESMNGSAFYREELGEVFCDYYAKMKQTEIERFEGFLVENDIPSASEEITQWEQDEYFDFF